MKFSNSSDMPIYGLNVQCAVPKYVTMEMKPPSSTSVPVSVGTDGNQVTQVIHVTNTMVGTKNLMLKLKVGFTSKGEKIEHMATCSNFPMGQF
jgi:AP-1 complex subunit gamma-1